MAKLINGLLGNSKKKVGNLVTYVLKGQQVARSKAANIANPRTQKQMSQRVKMANLVNFYRANKFWMDKLAFANKKQKWSLWNAFVHANIGTNKVYLTKTEASTGAAVVAPYAVSGGSINPVSITPSATAGKWYTDLYLGATYNPSNQTIGQFSQALIANNNGIERGMQLSLVENYQASQAGVPKITARAYEVIIDPDNTELLSTQINSGNFNVETVEGNTVVTYDTTQTGDAVGFAFILSRTTASGTEVSPASLVLTEETTYDTYKSDAQLASAIESYGSGESVPFLDSTEQQGSSNGSVSVPLTLMSAGGAAVGTYAGSIDSLKTGSSPEIVVAFNKSVEDKEITGAANIKTWTSNESYDISTSNITKAGNIVTIDFRSIGSGATHDLKEISIEFGGVVYKGTWLENPNGTTE